MANDAWKQTVGDEPPPYMPDKTASDSKMVVVARGIFEAVRRDYGGMPMWELALLLSWLRASFFIHQTNHWTSKGMPYYGDHLMLNRIYDDIDPEIDSVAERAVGTGSEALVEPQRQASHVLGLIKTLSMGGPGIPQSLWVEKVFQALFKMIYASLEASGQLSGGTDNLLQGIADKHETFVYLLQQRLTQAGDAWKSEM